MKQKIEQGLLLLLIGISLYSSFCNRQLIGKVQVLSEGNTRLIGRLCDLHSGEEEQ